MKIIQSLMKKKKDKGEIFSNIVPIVLTTLVIAIIIIAFTAWMAGISKKFDVNQIERKYALKMETNGYLTTQQYNDLRSELQSAGMIVDSIKTYGHNIGETKSSNKTININTPNANLKYGATIYLECKGRIKMFGYNIQTGNSTTEYNSTPTGLIGVIKSVLEIPITDIKSTTLKN